MMRARSERESLSFFSLYKTQGVTILCVNYRVRQKSGATLAFFHALAKRKILMKSPNGPFINKHPQTLITTSNHRAL